jgi:predicted alpha/beta-hydrolase family hydrolase
MVESRRVELDGGAAVTAVVYPSAEPAVATLVLAHGAGAGQLSDFMVGFAGALATRRLDVVTFNFPFIERGKKLPDPQPVLEACYRGVLAHVAADPVLGPQPLVIGGKSLGGRMASMLADEVGARGIVCLGYPFHPPGKPEQLRTAHLETLRTPALIVQGTRDPFGTPAEVAGYRLAPSIHVHWIEDGDHSLAPRKRSAQRAEGERSPIGPASGRTRGEARDEAIACVAEFVAAL